jgi:uncharacterized membrane protein
MWNELWEHHRGKCIGAAAGVGLGFIYLICGFWDMLIFAFIVVVGYYIGTKLDRKEEILPPVEDIWRNVTQKWRRFL